MAQSSQINRQQTNSISTKESTNDRSAKNVDQMEEQEEKITVTTNDIKEQLKVLPKPLLAAFGSACCLIILPILLIIPVIEIGIGAAYRDQCTINPNIPVYLIVTGACGVASIILMLVIVRSYSSNVFHKID